jgi:hypothetical protein
MSLELRSSAPVAVFEKESRIEEQEWKNGL